MFSEHFHMDFPHCICISLQIHSQEMREYGQKVYLIIQTTFLATCCLNVIQH